MGNQNIVIRPYALDAVEAQRIKATLGIDSAIEISIRVLLSLREVICGKKAAYNGGNAKLRNTVGSREVNVMIIM